MRVISGKYKGLYLVSFKASHIRPTSDRVKESMFNILAEAFEGARVLDLFSGTGNLGIEAISRGAAFVQFVDAHPQSIRIVRENLEKLKVTEPYQVTTKDIFRFLKSYQGDPFDVILIDPPFTEEMADEVMVAVSKSQVFSDRTVMAIESGRREKIGEDYSPLVRYDQREFGDKYLSLFHKKPEGADE